jgi:hypothetical protein
MGDALVGTITGMARGVFSVDFSPDRETVAIGGGDDCIRVVTMSKKPEI